MRTNQLFWGGLLITLGALLLRDPAMLLPLLAGRDAIEARWLAAPPHPREAFAEAERHLAAWSEAVHGRSAADRRPLWVRRYWRLRNRRAGLPAEVGS